MRIPRARSAGRRSGSSALALVTGLGALVGLPALGVATATPAAAAPTPSHHPNAQHQADRSARKLARLQRRLDRAVSDYQDALDGLTQQVSDGIAAQDAAALAESATVAAQDEHTNQVRALYMSGGQLGIYSSLLTAQSPSDLALRVVSAEHVIASADSGVSAASAAQSAAEQSLAKAQQRTGQAVVFADDVTAKAQRVDTLVAAERAAYRRLSATARRQAAAQRARAALDRASRAASGATSGAAGNAAAMPIPSDYLALYRSAARTCSGMDWTLLAAVGQVESGHGRNNGPSSAGAGGPMQFMPRTFQAYAVDGDHDGHTDPWDPADAIYTAARFLCAGGAGHPSGVPRALLRYNNAQWYVDWVLAVQQHIAAAY